MRLLNYGVAVLLALGLLACGGPAPEPAESGLDAVEQELSGGEFDADMDIRGLNLYMHEYAPTGGEARRPTLWMRAERGALSEREKVWAIEAPHAVVYTDDGEEITMQAEQGVFDEDNEIASLTGSVEVDTGTMQVRTGRIDWDNQKGVIRSEEKLELIALDSQIEAGSIELDPDTKAFRLTDVRGRFTLKKAAS